MTVFAPPFAPPKPPRPPRGAPRPRPPPLGAPRAPRGAPLPPRSPNPPVHISHESMPRALFRCCSQTVPGLQRQQFFHEPLPPPRPPLMPPRSPPPRSPLPRPPPRKPPRSPPPRPLGVYAIQISTDSSLVMRVCAFTAYVNYLD